MQIKITMRYPVTPNILVTTRKLDATRMVDCGGRAQGKWVWGKRIQRISQSNCFYVFTAFITIRSSEVRLPRFESQIHHL